MKITSVIALFTTIGLLSGCTGMTVEDNLNKKYSKEPTVQNSTELQVNAATLIEKSALTTEQKNRLKEVQIQASAQLQSIRQESLKLRSILIKDVFSAKYNKSEITLIQDKIKDLDVKRSKVLFDTIDKANAIFGRMTNAEENERIMDRLTFEHEYQ